MTILEGDALTRLRELPDRFVQTVITSPPYFGLRDYGTGEWEGGNDPGCEHAPAATSRTERPANGLTGGKATVDAGTVQRGSCARCGAVRVDQQIGLEDTPDEYVQRLVDVFREVRRVLRDDGTVWLNLGDSFNNRSVARPSSHQGGLGFTNDSIERSWADQTKLGLSRLSFTQNGLKEKDLLGIPWMVAFALRADGWYLRNDIILAKRNPMPESVRDRCTSSHEHMFLLTKQPRYYFDQEAIRERDSGVAAGNGFAGRQDHRLSGGLAVGGTQERWVPGAGRNKRDVWPVTSEPFADAHFATFGTRWIEPCVVAGSAPSACGECGAPWVRVVERDGDERDFEREQQHGTTGKAGRRREGADMSATTWSHRTINGTVPSYTPPRTATTGWQPSCDHDNDTGRSVVLDCFAGSGTVGVVCGWHDRDFLGIELSPQYAEMARLRILKEGRPGARHEPPSVMDGQLAMEV